MGVREWNQSVNLVILNHPISNSLQQMIDVFRFLVIVCQSIHSLSIAHGPVDLGIEKISHIL